MRHSSAATPTAMLVVVTTIGLSSALAEGQELDRDGDGVLDTEDACPDASTTNPYGGDGCPADPPPSASASAWVSAPPPRSFSGSSDVILGDEGDDGDEDRPGPAMRNTGIGLTVASLVVGTIGTAVGAHLSAQGHDEQVMGFLVGIGTGVLAGSMHVTGVTLWVVGAVRYKGPSSTATIPQTVDVQAGLGWASVNAAF
jgi:hypothetical protein